MRTIGGNIEYKLNQVERSMAKQSQNFGGKLKISKNKEDDVRPGRHCSTRNTYFQGVNTLVRSNAVGKSVAANIL